MGKPKILSDGDFIREFERVGPAEMARRLQCDVRGVFKRRNTLQKLLGRQIKPPGNMVHGNPNRVYIHPGQITVDLEDGVVLVGNDAHLWPGPPTTAVRAFIKFCKELKPKIVVLNGDMFDGASISRHPPLGWEKQPTVQDEIEAAQEILSQIEKAAFKARKIWPIGNHDERFERRLATVAPEFARVNGIHLRDHFPNWECCYSVWIGDVVCYHNFRGGMHAAHNNALWAGLTTITGHTHQFKIAPIVNLHGTHWGVEAGCLADINGRQFAYTGYRPRQWQSGFAVLTFRNGRVLMPELVRVFDRDHVDFRGQLIRV